MSGVLLTATDDIITSGGTAASQLFVCSAAGQKLQKSSKFAQGSLSVPPYHRTNPTSGPPDNEIGGAFNQSFRPDNGLNPNYSPPKAVVTKLSCGTNLSLAVGSSSSIATTKNHIKGPPLFANHLTNNISGYNAANQMPTTTATTTTTATNGFLHRSSSSKLDSPSSAHPSSAAAQKRSQKRLVFKSGDCNISHLNIRKRRRRFLADIFTTLVDIRWRWNLLLFTLAFILSWLVFAMVWWIICFSHGDFQHFGDDDWNPCVEKVVDFTSALLFSIETQHTIGYGHRHTTPHCPEAVVVMMVQSVFGVIIQALMTGLVFAKLQRPKKRAQTLMFSKHAVICQRDGQLCLLFRVGDMRKSHIIQSQVRAIVIKKRVTREGEEMPLNQFDVRIGGDTNAEGHLFLVWPMILEHRIDDQSPFWNLSADDLSKQDFELIVMLEGIVESTGMTTQARTSYVPSEILWGHRYRRLVAFQKDDGAYTVDFSLFNVTYPVPTPTCSARELELVTVMLGGDQALAGPGVSDDDSDAHSDRSPSPVSDPIGGPSERRPPTPSIMKWCEFGEHGLESFIFGRDDERLVKHDVTATLNAQAQSG